MREISFGRLLGAGFAVVIVFAGTVPIVARSYLGDIESSVNVLANAPIDNLIYIQQIKDGIYARSQSARDAILMGDANKVEDIVEQQSNLSRQAAAAREQLGERTINEQGAGFIPRLDAARADYDASLARIMVQAQSNRFQPATEALLRELPATQTAYLNVLNEMAAYQQDHALAIGVEAGDMVTLAVRLMTGLSIVSVLLGILVAGWLIRLVQRQLGGEPAYAAEIVRRISGSNLSSRIRLRKNDDSSLLAHMETMRQNLGNIVHEVRRGSESISRGTAQLAAGNTDLSHRTGQQAASLEQTASAMEQMTASVRHIADTARATSELAMKASAAAERGGQTMTEVVNTMDGITASSRKIGDVIGIIDAIAFQTNILALNAEVEAARAGSQGRGFAVVAGEVRALAQRSAQAAREITGLVKESVEKVQSGSVTVDRARGAIGDAVQQVRLVAGMIEAIGNATREQDEGISGVDQALFRLDEVTHQNAALVEEAAAAAESLNIQATQLVALVSAFKLDAATCEAGADPAAASSGREDVESNTRLTQAVTRVPRLVAAFSEH